MRKIYLLCILVLVSSFSFAQSASDSIKGQIMYGSNKDNLGGVEVLSVKPHAHLGYSNSDGTFKVKAKVGDLLEFSLVGYETKKIKATYGDMIVVMVETKGGLNDVSVMSFRNVKKDLITGATQTITSEDIKDQPAASVVDLLQGKVAGLNIQNNTGQPGAIGTINMRGLNGGNVSGGNNAFLTPTSPLFVVDGVPVDANTDYSYGANTGGTGLSPIALIPPDDIESLTVLKDAAATALWGSRGAYGVIIVTTKRGKSKIPIVDFNGMYFYSSVPELRPTLGGKDERDARLKELFENDTAAYNAYAKVMANSTPFLSDSLNPYYNNATDWQSVFYLPQSNYSATLNVSGGDDKFNYKSSFNYYNQKGIIEGTGYERYSVNLNGLYQPSPQFKLMVSLNSSLGSKKNGSGVGLLQTGVATSGNASSLLPPPSRYSDNATASATLATGDNSQTLQVLPSIDITYRPIDGPVNSLSINSSTNFNLNTNVQNAYQLGYTNGNHGVTKAYNDRTETFYNRNSINYQAVVQNVHTFTAFVFDEINSKKFTPYQYNLNGSSSDYIQTPGGSDLYTSTFGTLGSATELRTAAFGGAFSYNYKRKYVLDFQYRTDKSSNNGPLAGWKTNPSLSARWNFDKEKFIQSFNNSNWLDYGSVRLSYGKTTVPTGDIFSTYGTYAGGSTYNGGQTIYIDNDQIPNTNYVPTTITELDFGFEIGLWHNKVNFIYDYYYKQNDNQSMNFDLPSTSGFSQILTNDYSSVNYGHEFTLNVSPLSEQSKWIWRLSANLTINRNILTVLPNNLRQMTTGAGGDVPILHRLGRNDITMLMYETKGVYRTESDIPISPFTGLPLQIRNNDGALTYAEVGDPAWVDVNGDYIIDDNDLLPLGNPVPRVFGGITSNLTYKSWQLTTSVSFTLLRDIINTALAERLQSYGNPLSSTYGLYPIGDIDYFSPVSNPDGKYPYPFDYRRYSAVNPFRADQTLFMEDGSYWKLGQVTLSYSVDPKFAAKLKMSQLRFYATANNVLILSPYSGPNPENVSSVGRDDSGGYPNPKTYSLGVQVRF